MRVLLCLLVFLAFSCSDANMDTDPMSDCVPVIFDADKFNSQENFGVGFTEYVLDGNCLNVTLSVSGCDEVHPIQMVSDGSIAESFPPQITFDFYDAAPQDCEAIFQLDRSFDLSPISELYDGEIVVRFRNNDKSVIYIQ